MPVRQTQREFSFCVVLVFFRLLGSPAGVISIHEKPSNNFLFSNFVQRFSEQVHQINHFGFKYFLLLRMDRRNEILQKSEDIISSSVRYMSRPSIQLGGHFSSSCCVCEYRFNPSHGAPTFVCAFAGDRVVVVVLLFCVCHTRRQVTSQEKRK